MYLILWCIYCPWIQKGMRRLVDLVGYTTSSHRFNQNEAILQVVRNMTQNSIVVASSAAKLRQQWKMSRGGLEQGGLRPERCWLHFNGPYLAGVAARFTSKSNSTWREPCACIQSLFCPHLALHCELSLYVCSYLSSFMLLLIMSAGETRGMPVGTLTASIDCLTRLSVLVSHTNEFRKQLTLGTLQPVIFHSL